jgi:hypothetical protein
MERGSSFLLPAETPALCATLAARRPLTGPGRCRSASPVTPHQHTTTPHINTHINTHLAVAPTRAPINKPNMVDNFTTVRLALEAAELGAAVLQAARLLWASSPVHASQPRAFGDYNHQVRHVASHVESTTDVLKRAAVQLDMEQLGRWASLGGLKTATRAFESCTRSFNAMHEHFSKDPDLIFGCTPWLIAQRCSDAVEELASLDKDMERARTSVLLMLAVLKLKRDSSSSYRMHLTPQGPLMLIGASNDATIRLQHLQVQALAAQMKRLGLGGLQDADDAESDDSSVLSNSDVSSAKGATQHTPGTTPLNLRDGSSGPRGNDGPSRAWEFPARKYKTPTEGSVMSTASSSASSDRSQSPFNMHRPPRSSQTVDSSEVDTLLLQAAHSASSLASELATESHSWYKSRRLNSNAIRGSLEMLKSRVEGLLGTFEQCKGEMYFTPVSLLGPTPITDIVDCVPSNVRGPSPPIRKRNQSAKKSKKKASERSKQQMRAFDEPPTKMTMPPPPPPPPPATMMPPFHPPPPPPPPPAMMMPPFYPPLPPRVTDPFSDPFSYYPFHTCPMPPPPPPPPPPAAAAHKGNKPRLNSFRDAPASTLPFPPSPVHPFRAEHPGDPFPGFMPPGANETFQTFPTMNFNSNRNNNEHNNERNNGNNNNGNNSNGNQNNQNNNNNTSSSSNHEAGNLHNPFAGFIPPSANETFRPFTTTTTTSASNINSNNRNNNNDLQNNSNYIAESLHDSFGILGRPSGWPMSPREKSWRRATFRSGRYAEEEEKEEGEEESGSGSGGEVDTSPWARVKKHDVVAEFLKEWTRGDSDDDGGGGGGCGRRRGGSGSTSSGGDNEDV